MINFKDIHGLFKILHSKYPQYEFVIGVSRDCDQLELAQSALLSGRYVCINIYKVGLDDTIESILKQLKGELQ